MIDFADHGGSGREKEDPDDDDARRGLERMCGDVQGAWSEVVIKSIISADANSAGQAIVFPVKDGHITAALYEIPAGAVLPIHKHPSPRLGYVLQGELQVTTTENGKSVTYGPGSMVIESVGLWHSGANVGQTTLKLLVIDLCEKGQQTTIMQH